MPAELIAIEGTLRFPKLFEFNRDMGSTKGVNGAKYDYPEATVTDLVVDQDNMNVLLEAHPDFQKYEPTEDGILIKGIKRTWTNSVNPAWGGEPSVVDSDDIEWDRTRLIGNGTRAIVYAEVFNSSAPTGKSIRLAGVKVLDLVEPDLPDSPKLPWE
jgi:hypothetical protein